ncbi:hypothetical protein ANTQUA_LOCUS8045 [Anthophora quadrimaculata]
MNSILKIFNTPEDAVHTRPKRIRLAVLVAVQVSVYSVSISPSDIKRRIISVTSTRHVSNVTTAIFFGNIRRYCSDVQRFLSSASSPNFGRIEDRATDEEKQQSRNEKAEGKAGGMAEYSSRTDLQWLVAWTSKRTLI